jgi:hypothetical protein
MTYYEIATDADGRIDLRTGQLQHRIRPHVRLRPRRVYPSIPGRNSFAPTS